ncbi:hypothetical protein CB0940_03501, partial [Cercospora beticola]
CDGWGYIIVVPGHLFSEFLSHHQAEELLLLLRRQTYHRYDLTLGAIDHRTKRGSISTSSFLQVRATQLSAPLDSHPSLYHIRTPTQCLFSGINSTPLTRKSHRTRLAKLSSRQRCIKQRTEHQHRPRPLRQQLQQVRPGRQSLITIRCHRTLLR